MANPEMLQAIAKYRRLRAEYFYALRNDRNYRKEREMNKARRVMDEFIEDTSDIEVESD